MIEIDEDIVTRSLELITNTLEMKGERHPSIKAGVSGDLDRQRAEYANLDNEMNGKVEEEMGRIAEQISEGAEFPDFMRRVRAVMMPSIGYFLAVPKQGILWQQFAGEHSSGEEIS